MQREFDVVQQVCSKKLTSYDGYKENLKKGIVALMAVLSLALIGLKLPKSSP